MRTFRFLSLALAVVVCVSCSKSAQVYFESGNKYAATKQYKEAIVQYRSAIAKNPRFAEAHRKLADTYMDSGDQVNGFREYIRAADLLPHDAKLQIRAAQAMLLSGRYEDARTRLQPVLEKDPRNVEAQILRANALAHLKDLGGAIGDLESAIEAEPDRAATYANLGELQMAQGDVKDAEAAFKRAVATSPRVAEAHLALANFYWATSRRADAETELKQALAIDPTNITANRAIAVLYLSSNRAADAEAPLKVVAEHSKNPAASLALADYYTGMKRWPEATTVLERLAATNGYFATATLRLATIAFDRDDHATAGQLIAKVLAKEPKNGAALVTKSRLALADRHYDEAFAAARDAVAAEPENASAHDALGRAYAARADYDTAVTAFNDAVKLAPSVTGTQVELAKVYLRKGDPKPAIDLLHQLPQRALTADTRLTLVRALLANGDVAKAQEQMQALFKAFPNEPVVQSTQGMLAVARNDKVEARRAFEAAIQGDPDSREALVGLVSVDLASNDPKRAQQRVEEALKRRPKDADLMVLLARTLMFQKQPDQAESVLRNAIVTVPEAMEAYALLGRLYMEQHKLDQALTQFDRMASQEGTAIGARTLAATILELQNKPDEAKTRYERILELDPHAPVAANNLASLYSEHGGNLDMALQLAQTAKAQLPDQPNVNDTLGWIYAKKNLPELAIPPLTISASKEPNNPRYAYHLGAAYAKLGDKARARSSLEKAVKLGGSSPDSLEAKKLLVAIG